MKNIAIWRAIYYLYISFYSFSLYIGGLEFMKSTLMAIAGIHGPTKKNERSLQCMVILGQEK